MVAATFVVPTGALAAVKITDVMYNPPGADPGREWIQLTNTGTSSVNMAGYRLHAGGVNHKLVVAAGTSTLAAGAEAIITTDPGQYAADYPAFAGTVFKSSFSLSNTGETISLKDASLGIIDTYSYTAPPVVKDPVPVKSAKSVTNVSTPAKSAHASYSAGGNQAAAALLALPAVPALPKPWLYGLGLAAILALGAGAALYARPGALDAATETSYAADEFNIE